LQNCKFVQQLTCKLSEFMPVLCPAYMNNGLDAMPLVDSRIRDQLIKQHSLID